MSDPVIRAPVERIVPTGPIKPVQPDLHKRRNPPQRPMRPSGDAQSDQPGRQRPPGSHIDEYAAPPGP